MLQRYKKQADYIDAGPYLMNMQYQSGCVLKNSVAISLWPISFG